MPWAPTRTARDSGTMTTSAIRWTGVTKRFGAVTAVDDLTLAIEPGEVVALLGPNGAGKTTTIDLALGLGSPTTGAAELFGLPPRRAIVAGRVGAMLQGGALLPDLTVAQCVALVAAAHRRPSGVGPALERAGATGIASRRVSRLSGGETQRARFAVAIVSDPDLLVLDEPTAAMDVEARHLFWSSMRELTASGRTVVFATHYLDEADAFADRVVILQAGRVVADGTPAEVKAVVAGRTISFTTHADAPLAALPAVTSVERRGTRVTLTSADSDATLRALLATWPDARDVLVSARTMDDAFLALTSATEQEAGR